VTYFKPFKIVFRKEQNVAMAKKQLFGTRQIHLVRMVRQSFAKNKTSNLGLGFAKFGH
jgi:hypothetical protein